MRKNIVYAYRIMSLSETTLRKCEYVIIKLERCKISDLDLLNAALTYDSKKMKKSVFDEMILPTLQQHKPIFGKWFYSNLQHAKAAHINIEPIE